ncbi:MAG: hypothetical protein A2687_01600 [Candidatus Levybacteria bacterium RIFCSPHIGHO2_01_FULL_38_26]|nr:MAG: hypothetical protein A2687_01600 [Candidatus Levybacteria bacterium RIFCSPHIGHO2_01_FULL_38_26]
MKIAIDISPLEKSSLLAHRVRGTGFYIDNLKKSLLKYFPQNKYIFFTRGENLPKDINLVHYTYFEPFFLSLPVIKAQKTVVTVHDLTPLVFKKFFPAGIKGNFKWQIQKLGLKTANAVITDSESSKKDIIKYTGLPSSRVNVVYLAAGEEFKRIKNIKNKYNLPEKFVLYVGDVTWNKNLPRLIEAVKKINVSFVMIGSAIMQKNFDRSNPWNQDLSKILKLTEDDKKIIKLGFVSQEDLVAIYNLSTVFAMPSLYEGFGLPILEAMSCGCPVVTTKEGSIQEIAGEAAYYVNAYDVDDIANGIGELFFSQKLQQELSEKGLIQAKKFSWKKTAEETIGVYEQATL